MVRNQPYEGGQPQGEDPRSLREQATRSREHAQQAIHEGTEQAKQQLGAIGEQLRERGEHVVEEQRHMAAEKLHHCGAALRQAGQKLHEDNDHTIAGYCDTMARQLDKAADYVESHDIRACARDIQDLARRQPELVIGGALLAGLVIARFLKAASDTGSSIAERPQAHRVQAAVPASETGGFGGESRPYEPVGGSSPMQSRSDLGSSGTAL
jgi:hypothetical protein